ncbi:hypothetical protein EG68_03439 [Paragonimus skrjabini miyazakii]|uniref:J domain-containing protein n=1 Tax=Paragonimus skrjabini miyazakii TaxID=59628 RepID=A0A8S9YV36_9TREM|nr:hypothetical protein EG68_03439 [Paragonimus skrjabini miyazakii]
MGVWLLLFALVLSPGAWASRDYYDILGVKRDASMHEIKREFRKLARGLHPDHNKDDPKASEKFQELSRAYEVLSDPEKRKHYDHYGDDDARGSAPSDLFRDFFGFGFDFGGSKASDDTPRGHEVVLDIFVTLEELCIGDFVEITRVKLEKRNAKGTRKCRCRREMRTTMLGPGQFQMHQVDVCDDCPNVEFFPEERHLELEIEPGMREGQIYPFALEGEPHIDGENGDLKFRIQQQKHRYFQRRGDDLYTNLTLSLAQSLVGYHLSFTHPDGHQVILKSDKLTPPGTVIHKPGEGVPNYENPRVHGSLYITVDVAYPSDRQLSDEERTKILTIFPDTSSAGDQKHSPHTGPPIHANVYNGLDQLPRSQLPKVTT